MVSRQHTQTAGNRRGDPIRGAAEKEGTDYRQEKQRNKRKKTGGWSFSWPLSDKGLAEVIGQAEGNGLREASGSHCLIDGLPIVETHREIHTLEARVALASSMNAL